MVTPQKVPTREFKAGEVQSAERDLRLDACRGLALLFIFLDHVPNNVFSWLTLRNYGFSDTTEVFVFVSGYTCMLAYGGELRERGSVVTAMRALRRGWEIYVAFLLLVLAYIAIIQAIGGGQPFVDETNTAAFLDQPGIAILRAMMMQYTPVNTDVLPTFVLLHLFFPILLWLLTRAATLALLASLALYILVQAYSWNFPAWPRGQWFFNPLAWQMLFVFGAWYVKEGAQLNEIVRSWPALLIATLYLVFGFGVTMSWQLKSLEGFLPEVVSNLIYPVDKSNLAPPRLLHFLALAIVATQLIPPNWRGLTSTWLTALIRCGENSLAIYCLGVLLSFFGHVILFKFSSGLVMQTAVSVGGIAILIVAATAMTWTANKNAARPKLF